MKFTSLLLTLLCLLLAAEARAQSASTPEPAPSPGEAVAAPHQDPKAEASERFLRGLQFYEEGDFALALIEFDRAYQLVPDYRVLYNVGQVSIQLSKFARARSALSAYLEQGKDEIDPERKEAVAADLRMLAARTAYLALTVNVQGAEIVVDDLPRGISPLDEPLLLDAGQHRVVVSKQGYSDQTRHLTLAGADTVDVSIQLEQVVPEKRVVIIQKEEGVPSGSPPHSNDAPRTRRVSPWLVAGWSTTGVLIGGATVFGILGVSQAKQAKSIAESPNPSVSEHEHHQNAAKNHYRVADILGAGAILVGGTSLYFTIRPPHRGRETARSDPLQLVVSPTHLSLRSTF